MTRFVIVIDTQKDFMAADSALSVAGADALIDPMNAWLAARDPAKTAGVLFTYDTHDPQAYAGSAEAEAFPIHCVRGSDGWRNMLDERVIDPAIPVWRLEKTVFDMWAEDGLTMQDARDAAAPPVLREDFFADLQQAGVKEVEVIGVAADYCVRWAIDGLIARGFRVIVPAALTRGIAREIDQVAAEDFVGAPLFVKG
ncbi:isochorismatase family protein [Altererythrobacter xixiisoli]|uniref:nicotinamidase n=1 Tax=Croceibacterium xixiisoli TaxID=1476466 RepID=A0A6I4TTN5_9SPHN|nr:isochorismatase family cysteine hydrolase [Croceibacterium xixiisoli]MXO98590.1 isochorismatase family protein [Croceibacterium xixiisoli]